MGILSNTRIALTTAVLIVPSVTLAEIETPAHTSIGSPPSDITAILPTGANTLFDGISTWITAADNTLTNIMNKMIGTANAATTPTAAKIVAISATSYDISRARLPELAIDGDPSTKWTALIMPQWLILDLGSIQSISGINMQMYVANNGANANYAVDVSSNKIGWTTVVPNTGLKSSSGSIQKNFTPITGRYMRLRLSSTNYSDYVNLTEIVVYAQALSGDTGDDINNIQLTLTWKPSAGSIQGYKVFYGATASSVTTEISDISNTLSTSFNPATPKIKYDSWYTLRLLAGDSVCFKVRAYNADGLSTWSLPICGVITEAAS